VVVSVREEYQYGCEDVVYKHLQIVFALLFDVYDKDLLKVECPLDEVVEFEQALDLSEGPALPNAV
jgi:hypothetical protein